MGRTSPINEFRQPKESLKQLCRVPDVLTKPPKKDYLDKLNKHCSSCIITFDSRTLFIKHLTTIHQMKFKTSAGQAISAPLFQVRFIYMFILTI